MNLREERRKLENRAKILTIIYTLGFMFGLSILKLKKEHPKILSEAFSYFIDNTIYIDLEEARKLLGNPRVNEETLNDIINQNDKITENYRESAQILIQKRLKNDPDYDFAIFYDNLKTLETLELDEEEFKNIVRKIYGYDAHVSAFYSPKENKIYSLKACKPITRIHELEHVANNWQKTIDGKTYIYNPSIYQNEKRLGTSIEEAMDNEAIKDIEKNSSYQNERIILEYLQTFIEYDYADFHKEGIDGLIDAFNDSSSKDIVLSIIKELDKIQKRDLKENNSKNIKDYQELLDLCFKLCCENIDIESPYLRFANFSYLIEQKAIIDKTSYQELLINYLKEYNKILEGLGIKDIILPEEIINIISTFKEVDCLECINNGKTLLMPGIKDKNKSINFDGTKTEHNKKETRTYIPNFESYLVPSYFRHKNIYGTNDFWITLNEDYKIMPPFYYRSIPIYFYNEQIEVDNPRDLSIKIGCDEEGNLRYTVKNGKSIIIGRDCPLETNEINLIFFIYEYNYIDEIHLEDILNDDYVKFKAYLFNNLKYDIKTDTLKVIPNYRLRLTDIDIEGSLNALYYNAGPGFMGELFLDEEYIPLDYIPGLKKGINIKEVLKYFGIFNEDKIYYELTREQLMELIAMYVEDNREDLIDPELERMETLTPYTI